jgi:hypothetical protein
MSVTLWRISAGLAGFCILAEVFFAALFAAALGFDFFIRCTLGFLKTAISAEKTEGAPFWRAL